jgi:hypothetical protein
MIRVLHRFSPVSYGGELFLPAELAERFERYKSREPVASIGYSLLVFKQDFADPQVYEDGAMITARMGAVKVAEALLHKALHLNPANARVLPTGCFHEPRGQMG